MKRFIWIATIFGGGVALLMFAAVYLQNQTRPPVDDLKAAVAGVRQGLAEGNYEKVRQYTGDIPAEAYQKIFDEANSGNPDLARKFKGALSSMDAFPSMRFPEGRPERVDVNYDVVDGPWRTVVGVSFVPGKEGGYFLKSLHFPVGPADNSPVLLPPGPLRGDNAPAPVPPRPAPRVPAKLPPGAIVFHPDDNISLAATVDRLFDLLGSEDIDAFRSLVMVSGRTPEEARKVRDDLRAQVMACRSDRLKKLVPTVGPLPKGTRWFRVLVVGRVDGRRMFLDIDVVPDKTVRIRNFRAGLARESAAEKPATQPTTP